MNIKFVYKLKTIEGRSGQGLRSIPVWLIHKGEYIMSPDILKKEGDKKREKRGKENFLFWSLKIEHTVKENTKYK